MSSVSRAPAAVAGVFYLDDPQDGASTHLLAEIGVALTRAAAAGAGAVRHGAGAGMTAVALSEAEFALACLEHDAKTPVEVRAAGEGGILVDVRDSADAWVRIVLHDGDTVTIAPGTKRRVPAPGTQVWTPNPITDPAVLDRDARQTTHVFAPPAPVHLAHWGMPAVALPTGTHGGFAGVAVPRFRPGSAEAAAAEVPHFHKPGVQHTRDLVVDLCESFYHLGWVTGTGGSISIRHGNRIFMAPSSVQKERMQRQDMFVLDTSGAEIYCPAPLPGKRKLKLSQCAPLFQHAFNLRKAGGKWGVHGRCERVAPCHPAPH
jgi:hypothetical protein